MTTLKFFGHSCFLLSKGETALLCDPFLTGNPFQIAKPKELVCNYILVSHGHFDHLGDTVEIANLTGATVISTAEIAQLCGNQGCKNHAMHLGGKHAFDFGSVKIAPAFHGSGVPGGHACGFVVDFFGSIIYFAGDTALFGDMELLGRRDKIDYALLPIGDNFTMGPQDAAEAAALLKPRFTVPMHYNTWPLIAQSPEEFKHDVESRFRLPVETIEPGKSLTLK